VVVMMVMMSLKAQGSKVVNAREELAYMVVGKKKPKVDQGDVIRSCGD